MPHPQAAPRLVTRLGAAFALALLTSCANVAGGSDGGVNVLIFSEDFADNYTSIELRSAGSLPLEIQGAPPDGAAPEAIAAAMTLPRRLGGTALNPVAPGGGGRRLAIGFFLATPERLCRGGNAGSALDDKGRMQVSLAYCWDDRMLSGAQARINGSRGPNDPGFREAMMRLYARALPTKNTNAPRSSPR